MTYRDRVTPAQRLCRFACIGSAGVTDQLWARLLQNDGTLTSWQQFTVSTHT